MKGGSSREGCQARAGVAGQQADSVERAFRLGELTGRRGAESEQKGMKWET
jgi:hypothetical protein